MKDVSRYSKVFVKIWSSKDFRSLSNNGKLTFMYLLTSPHRNMGGYYVLPFPYLCFDVGLTEEDARAALQEIIDIGMAMYDYDTHVVLITNWFRYNPIENTNQAKGLNRQLGEMPASFLFSYFAEQVEEHCKFPETVLKGLEEEISMPSEPAPEDNSSESKENSAESTVSDTLSEDERNRFETLSKPFANPSETLSKPFQNPIANQEQEQEQEQEQKAGDRNRKGVWGKPESQPPNLDTGVYERVKKSYNDSRGDMPEMRSLTDKRKKMIRARLKTHSENDIHTVFLKAAESDFLSGRSGQWQANFDWLLNPNNFVKVLEGNYASRASPKIPRGFQSLMEMGDA